MALRNTTAGNATA